MLACGGKVHCRIELRSLRVRWVGYVGVLKCVYVKIWNGYNCVWLGCGACFALAWLLRTNLIVYLLDLLGDAVVSAFRHDTFS